MRLACFEFGGARRLGVVEGDRVVPLAAAAGPTGVAALDPRALPGTDGPALAVSAVRLLAPVPVPPRVFGIGLNYRDHAAETGREPPAVQTWFMKQPTSVLAPFGEVERPCVSDRLDFEVELVGVIGKPCRHVPPERAFEVLAGWCVGCDYSVRDWQRATPTMIMGKGFDTHAPMGPWLTTADAVGDTDGLALTCDVNGVRMQDGRAGDMIFKWPEMVAHLSAAMTLLPGDCIFTGTPAGVGVAREPPVFLKAGDVVRCAIAGLGAIEQRVVDEVKRVRIG